MSPEEVDVPRDEDTEPEVEQEYNETFPFKYSITSYGADYPVDGLVKRLRNGSVFIPPFQRQYTWPKTRASRFVESLLLGLPVPGVFLSKEQDTEKLLVIDGQQRLKTLLFFYDGIFADTGREFRLEDVQSQFDGETYKSVSDEDRRRLDDSIIHATIVKQDEPSEDDSSIYHIFERLNTGGLQLVPQEIRACIYHGLFEDELKRLNGNPAWRRVFGKPNKKMRDRELILRFLALFFDADAYTRPMKQFLNTYMARNRHLTCESSEQMEKAFAPTIEMVSSHIGRRAFRRRGALNAAIFDAVMVGLARRLHERTLKHPAALQEAYEALMTDSEFTDVTETSTTTSAYVRKRLDLATDAFANLK